MKKRIFCILLVFTIAATMLCGCGAALQFSYFGTDSQTLLKNISKTTGEKVPDFTLYEKTDGGLFVYLTRVNNVYITIDATDTYNKLQVALSFTDLTEDTVATFGAVCGSAISTIDPAADTDALVEALGMESYTLNATNTYDSGNMHYEYTATGNSIYFTMYNGQ